jgi:Tol biopolymer transport system component
MKPSVTFLLLTLATLTACGLLGSNGENNRPDIPGKIVFAGEDGDGTSQIYTMNADGAGLRQLTSFPPDGGAADPAWSPDGQRIVFSNFTGATSLGPYLYVMGADGSNMRPLKKRQSESMTALVGSAPAWSPNGSLIAFEVCTNCELGGSDYEISVVEAAGTDYDPEQIHAATDHPAGDTNPTWSPDGRRIAFVSDRDYVEADTLRFRQDLYLVDADGGNLQRLTETGNATRPKWSPDSKKIAYEWNIQGNEVYVYDLADGQIQKIESGLQFAGNPLWDKEGNRLLIFGRETENTKPEMRLINIESGTIEVLHKITLDKIGTNYDWYHN